MMFKRSKKPVEPVVCDVRFEPKISRLFIFRFLWAPVIMVPFMAYAVWFGLLSLLHFVYMLLLGKRSRDLFDLEMDVVRYMVRWQMYLRFFTDKRPTILL